MKFYVVKYPSGKFVTHYKSWSMPAMYTAIGIAKRYAKVGDKYFGAIYEIDLDAIVSDIKPVAGIGANDEGTLE